MKNLSRLRLALLALPALLALGVLVGLSGDGKPEEAAGTVCGAVRFTGKVPPPRDIPTTDGGTVRHSDLLVEPKTKGLRDVLAVLEDAPARPRLEKAESVVVDQKDMLFVPRVVAVQHGRSVRFENSDAFNHSVMTASLVKADQFNVFVAPGRPLEHTFAAQKQPVRVGCSLHASMRAWVYVVPHPWFALTDAKGRFTIERVPPGKYTLWLRHADSGLQERRPVEVQAGERADVAVEWAKVE
jgi:plastocyanin